MSTVAIANAIMIAITATAMYVNRSLVVAAPVLLVGAGVDDDAAALTTTADVSDEDAPYALLPAKYADIVYVPAVVGVHVVE